MGRNHKMEMPLALLLLLCEVPLLAVGAPVIYDISGGGAGGPIDAAVGTRSQLGDGVQAHDSWTGGVDSQMSMAQAELAMFRARSVQGRNAIYALKTKSHKEKMDLKMAIAKDPKGIHISEGDIDKSYGRLIQNEEQMMTDAHTHTAEVVRYIKKLRTAKMKIEKAKLGVTAIEEIEKRKKNQEHVIAARLYKQFKQQEDGSFGTWKKGVEKAMMVKHELKNDQDIWNNKKKNMQTALEAEKKVKAEMAADSVDAEDTQEGIIQRIRDQSDTEIRTLTAGADEMSNAVKKFAARKAKVIAAVKKMKEQARPQSFTGNVNITQENEVLQQNANAVALTKLMEKNKEDAEEDDEDDEFKQINHEYEAHKTFEMQSKLDEKLANMQMNDELHNLTAWHMVHKEGQDTMVKKFLTKIHGQDQKDAELNIVQLEANHLLRRKKALLEIIVLKKSIADLEKHKSVLEAERTHLNTTSATYDRLVVQKLATQINQVRKQMIHAIKEEDGAEKLVLDMSTGAPSGGTANVAGTTANIDFLLEKEKQRTKPKAERNEAGPLAKVVSEAGGASTGATTASPASTTIVSPASATTPSTSASATAPSI